MITITLNLILTLTLMLSSILTLTIFLMLILNLTSIHFSDWLCIHYQIVELWAYG